MSWLEAELQEQPAALARLIDKQAGRAREIAEMFSRDDVQYVLIASRGSSGNAARYAQYVLGRAHRVPVMFATPSLYTIYEQPPRLDGAVVVGISQSGASPDVASVLAEARRQGRPTVALTNALDSRLAREADAVLLLEAGEERAVAATKTYLNSLGAIAMLFAAVDGPVAEAERYSLDTSAIIACFTDEAGADRLEGCSALRRGDASRPTRRLAEAVLAGRGARPARARSPER